MQAQTTAELKVLHFVTGGFSGATQVAIDLCQAAQRTPGMEVMLDTTGRQPMSMASQRALGKPSITEGCA